MIYNKKIIIFKQGMIKILNILQQEIITDNHIIIIIRFIILI